MDQQWWGQTETEETPWTVSWSHWLDRSGMCQKVEKRCQTAEVLGTLKEIWEKKIGHWKKACGSSCKGWTGSPIHQA